MACTIFVLANGRQALFFNNEDWSNPRSRIWFLSAGPKRYGRVCLGFNDGWVQGGMNTKGLAFDWVAGRPEPWSADPALEKLPGNPSERMLETCATVEDAIAFYSRHLEPGFSYGRILIADASGASVVIRAEAGKLRFERAQANRGLGYCGPRLQKMLAEVREPGVANGSAILRACLQQGLTATKYSYVFDLKTGAVYLFDKPESADGVNLRLGAELAKGEHYYEIPRIRQQLARPPMPLAPNMQRNYLDSNRRAEAQNERGQARQR
jgi:hypothetical protein